jgi:hypothetical protein
LINKHWVGEDENLSDESDSDDSIVEELKEYYLGQKLEAKWKDGEYYYGEINKIYKNGNYGFTYTDGSKDKHRSIDVSLMRERTPIVDWNISDISDGISESDSEESEEQSNQEVLVEGKKYYWLALKDFLDSQLGDCKYFLNGKRTNHTESFHNICNMYCPKGSNISMKMYIMKKQFAALHWNNNKLYNNEEIEDNIEWKFALLNEFLKKKKIKKIKLFWNDNVNSIDL